MTDQGKSEGPAPQGRKSSRGRHFRSGKRPEGGQRGENPRTDEPSQKGQPVPRNSPAFSCVLCGKPVYDLSNALADRESGLPAHFDCVIERVAAAETLGPGEKVVYLGSGAFAVVEFKDRSELAFTVKRRIQWEKEGEKKDWRRTLSAGILKI